MSDPNDWSDLGTPAPAEPQHGPALGERVQKANTDRLPSGGGGESWADLGEVAKPTPQQSPGLFAKLKSRVTGEGRTEFPNAEEFESAYAKRGGATPQQIASGVEQPSLAGINRSQITSDPAAALDILKKHVPGLEAQQDKYGNLMLRAPQWGVNDWTYLNKPGLSKRDLEELGTQTLATLPFMGAAGQGATIPARIASGAGFMGAAELAREGMERAAGSEQEHGAAPLIAATGAGAVGAPGLATEALRLLKRTGQAVAEPFVNMVRGATNPAAEASRRVGVQFREAMQNDPNVRGLAANVGLDIADPATLEWLARNRLTPGEDIRLMDTFGERGRALARSAANTSPEARDTIMNVVQPRFEAQSARLGTALEDIAGGDLAGQSREALEHVANTARAPFYREAFEAGANGLMTPELERLAATPAVAAAMRRATVEMQNREGAGRLVTQAHGPNGPTLEFWDQVKRNLNDRYRQLSNAGRNSDAGTVRDLTQALVAHLDEAFPEVYSRARGIAMGLFRANNALEAGENFVTHNIPSGRVEEALRELNPQERELFRQGYVSRLLERMNQTGDRRNLAAILANSPNEREKLELALGPIPARRFQAEVNTERLMDLSRTAAAGNSTTARQLMELGLAGGTGALISGFDPHDPAGWIAAILTKYGAHRAGHFVDTRVANQIAQMLASRDATVVRQGVELATRHEPILDAMRRAVDATAGIGRNVATQEAAKEIGGDNHKPSPNAMRSSEAQNNSMVADVPSGATATNPRTGERLRFDGRGWQTIRQ